MTPKERASLTSSSTSPTEGDELKGTDGMTGGFKNSSVTPSTQERTGELGGVILAQLCKKDERRPALKDETGIKLTSGLRDGDPDGAALGSFLKLEELTRTRTMTASREDGL